jgi:hypothetical protein
MKTTSSVGSKCASYPVGTPPILTLRTAGLPPVAADEWSTQ